MHNPVSGRIAAPTASSLPTLRAQLTALTFRSPHLSEAEQLRANHHIHECEDAERLTHWLQTVKAELARRSIAAQAQGRPLPPPYVLDHAAEPRDRRAATQFKPARTLTYAQLLRR
jgi:hypothetical protein